MCVLSVPVCMYVCVSLLSLGSPETPSCSPVQGLGPRPTEVSLLPLGMLGPSPRTGSCMGSRGWDLGRNMCLCRKGSSFKGTG